MTEGAFPRIGGAAREIEWLGKIPPTWDRKRLKFLVQFIGGGTPTKDTRHFWGGEIPWVSPKDMTSDRIATTQDHLTVEGLQSSSSHLVPSGAVLLVVRSGILRRTLPVAINMVEVALNQDMKALMPTRDICAPYLAYLIRGHQHNLLNQWRRTGATVESVESELLSNTLIPVPPSDEQRAIAAFLDRETARIDALVKKKERLIELLEEKRTALISRAVTKGLNPDAPMKDSGNLWVPEKPAHWGTTKLGYVCRLFSGGTPSKDNLAYWSGSMPWVSPKDMKVFEVHDSEDHVSKEAIEDAGLWLIQPEAVLIVVRGMILAHSFPVALSKREITINQDMKALLPRSDCSAEYLAYLLRGMKDAMLANVEESAHGTKCLRTDVWKGIEISVPPLPEQEAICRWIKQQTATVDRLVAKVIGAIEKLREYRTALISAAVTGKIDVREKAA